MPIIRRESLFSDDGNYVDERGGLIGSEIRTTL